MLVVWLTMLSAFSAVILLGSRQWALLSMLAGVMYMPAVAELSVAGFAMFPGRVLMVVAIARVVTRKELSSIRLTRFDRLLVLLYAYTIGVFLIRSDEGQAYQIGTGVDALLTYFAARALCRSFDDFNVFLRGVAVLLIPYVGLVWIESLTWNNPFAPIGGVELVRAGDLWVRGGRLRATGAFGHPSLLGTFAGTFFALFVALLLSRGHRSIGLAGAAMCVAIVMASNSGGPVACLGVAMAGWMLWPFRRHMAVVRMAIFSGLVMLALFMKAPIWFVFARVSSVTGGDGWHRSELLDAAIRHIDVWWLAGMPVLGTSKWLPYTNTVTGAVDMTNHFLVFGIAAGFGAVLLLVAVLVRAFGDIGKAAAALRSQDRQLQNEAIVWSLGVMMGVHVFNWFGITYWDQTHIVLFIQLAILGSLTARNIASVDRRRVQGERIGRKRGEGDAASVASHHSFAQGQCHSGNPRLAASQESDASARETTSDEFKRQPAHPLF